jgi:protein-glutamine gamma-glutamyltransferase
MSGGAAERQVPPVLAALVLWGWQTELLPWALGMGVLIEAARFSRLRLELGQGDFNRLWNFTTLLFLGVGLYLFLARQGLGTVGSLVSAGSPNERLDGMRQLSQTAIMFLRGLPFVLFPFVLIHAWSRSTTLPWSTFSLYLRARGLRAPEGGAAGSLGEARVHPGYLYFGTVLFASCASALHPLLYPVLLVGVLGWGLWPWRSRRFGAPVWVGMLVVLLGSMLVVQRGVVALREVLQALENRLLQRVGEERFNQLNSFTALGSVGRLKLSGRIALRVRTDRDVAPGLLREAAFNRFRGNTWGSAHRDFQPVGGAIEGFWWRLAEERRGGRLMEVSRYTAGGEAPLALPGQPVLVRDLSALTIETNYLAAARMRGAPRLASYTVDYGNGVGFDGPPGEEDRDLEHLSGADREVIGGVAEELGLSGLSGREAVVSLERFFAAGFEYSIWQGGNRATTNSSALGSFLREWRSGHCEYYATATVLLLRAAGVPTRYAVGYSIDERRDGLWLARGRDAHAWCLAYLDGRWLDVDTTPGEWREREAAEAGWWEGPADWISDAWYRFALWRQQGGNWRIYVLALSMTALSWLAWRQLRGSRWRRAHATRTNFGKGDSWPGMDSEFYAVIGQLERAHGARHGHETLRRWICRLHRGGGTPRSDALFQALGLHNRHRFDPCGLTKEDRERLRGLVRELTGIQ